jgi:hypothetical protein
MEGDLLLAGRGGVWRRLMDGRCGLVIANLLLPVVNLIVQDVEEG